MINFLVRPSFTQFIPNWGQIFTPLKSVKASQYLIECQTWQLVNLNRLLTFPILHLHYHLRIALSPQFTTLPYFRHFLG